MVSVQSTAGSRGVRISRQRLYRPCSDAQCKAAGYPLHSHLSPSLPLPCVTVCHQVPNALYLLQDGQHATANASNLEHNVTIDSEMFRLQITAVENCSFTTLSFITGCSLPSNFGLCTGLTFNSQCYEPTSTMVS